MSEKSAEKSPHGVISPKMRHTKIQIIGNYFNSLLYPLSQRGIIVENIIGACNPLVMIGDKNEEIAKKSEAINSVAMQLMAKGNLAQMLSRDSNKFCPNIKSYGIAQNVRYCNSSEYIVVCNNICGYSLFLYRNSLYSESWPQNELLDMIKNDKSTCRIEFPYRFLDWKYIYDHFIDTILNEYDSEHIILIRTNAMHWYLNGSNFIEFDEKVRDYRNQVEQMDSHFLERTECHCIDSAYAHIADRNVNSAFKYSSLTGVMYKDLEYALDEIINKKVNTYRRRNSEFYSPLAIRLYKLLSTDVLRENEAEIKKIESKRIYSVKYLPKNSEFTKNLSILSKFIDGMWRYSLSDFLAEQKNLPLSDEYIELLTLGAKYLKLGLDELVGLYQVIQKSDNKMRFRTVVKNLCGNSDFYPLSHTRSFVNKNLDRLSRYDFIEQRLLTEKYVGQYVRLDNGCLFLLDPNADNPLTLINTGVKNSVSLTKIIDNDYVCEISEADALCSNWGFYIKRAREGKGNFPVTILFSAVEDFVLSLAYIDYTELLENENFIISCNKNLKEYDLKKFKARTNLDFLFKKGTRLCHLRSGLADQIQYYLIGKVLECLGGGTTYYDDIYTNITRRINGTEINKITIEHAENRFLSEILSQKLISVCKDITISDILYKNGLTEMCVVVNKKHDFDTIRLCHKFFITNIDLDIMHKISNVGIPYYCCWVRPVTYLKKLHFNICDYIQFPPLDNDDKNLMIINEMANCDAVAVHVRRGDYVTLGWCCDNSYYVEALQKLYNIQDYTNKKFFIFSDDIPWCREHISDLGFSLFSDSEIFFIDFNKDITSFRDMQLMSYAKIIICSHSFFAEMATLLANRCEVLMFPNKDLQEIFEKNVRKNKYDVGSFSKNYIRGRN